MKKFKVYFRPLIVKANSAEDVEEMISEGDIEQPETDFIAEDS